MSAKAAPCAEGSYGNATGLESQANCTACPEGHSCGVGVSQPTPCGAGTVAPNASMGTCVDCAAGTFQDEPGKQACKPCEPGSYCPEGASSPLPCKEGTYSNTTGLESDEQCTKADPGYFATTGSTKQTPCSPGTFAANASSQLCLGCPDGKYQGAASATACSSWTARHSCTTPAPRNCSGRCLVALW